LFTIEIAEEDRPRRSRANRPLSSGRTVSPITKEWPTITIFHHTDRAGACRCLAQASTRIILSGDLHITDRIAADADAEVVVAVAKKSTAAPAAGAASQGLACNSSSEGPASSSPARASSPCGGAAPCAPALVRSTSSSTCRHNHTRRRPACRIGARSPLAESRREKRQQGPRQLRRTEKVRARTRTTRERGPAEAAEHAPCSAASKAGAAVALFGIQDGGWRRAEG